jgi:hypothetical protein
VGRELLVSASLLIEYEAVLKPEEHRAASGASIEDVDGVLDALARIAEPVEISYLWRPHLADPGDELVLETAVNGRAENDCDVRFAPSRCGCGTLRHRGGSAPDCRASLTGAALVRKSN